MHQFQTMKKKNGCIRKTHPAEGPEYLEPYWKKLRLTQFNFLRNKAMIQVTFTKFKKEDLSCVAAFNNIQYVPMWTG